LTLFYGHNSWGQAGCHDQLLDRYEEWLVATRQSHSPERLRYWVYHGYDANKVVR
jgi:hypothetical protein